jgi:hypothetical protein
MYCRETTDAATEHIAALPITYYYAGLTLITDRSLEMLGKMLSLEQVELSECRGVTEPGLVSLAGLPRLHAVELGGRRVSRSKARRSSRERAGQVFNLTATSHLAIELRNRCGSCLTGARSPNAATLDDERRGLLRWRLRHSTLGTTNDAAET